MDEGDSYKSIISFGLKILIFAGYLSCFIFFVFPTTMLLKINYDFSNSISSVYYISDIFKTHPGFFFFWGETHKHIYTYVHLKRTVRSTGWTIFLLCPTFTVFWLATIIVFIILKHQWMLLATFSCLLSFHLFLAYSEFDGIYFSLLLPSFT